MNISSFAFAINSKKGETVTIDLGGKELKTAELNIYDSDKTNKKSAFALEIYGTVILENCTVSSRGIMVKEGGSLILGENVTINATDKGGGFAINCQGGEVTINGGAFPNTSNSSNDFYSKETGQITNNVK